MRCFKACKREACKESCYEVRDSVVKDRSEFEVFSEFIVVCCVERVLCCSCICVCIVECYRFVLSKELSRIWYSSNILDSSSDYTLPSAIT